MSVTKLTRPHDVFFVPLLDVREMLTRPRRSFIADGLKPANERARKRAGTCTYVFCDHVTDYISNGRYKRWPNLLQLLLFILSSHGTDIANECRFVAPR